MTDYLRKEVIGDCTLYLGDCMDVMPTLGKVDAVVTDLPYGTTQCAWDNVIPFDQFWRALTTVQKPQTPFITTASQPFTSLLIASNVSILRYCLVWDKVKGTGYLNAKKQPMRNHEDVVVFYQKPPTYNPQKTVGHINKKSFRSVDLQSEVYGKTNQDYHYESTERYPRSILVFSTDTQNSSFHPTQKPVLLFQYLIETYSNAGDAILDPTMGSGTTGVACAKMGRKFIGIELDESYFEIACQRIRDAYAQPDMFVEPIKSNSTTQERLL